MCGITKYRLKALLAMQVVLFSLKAQSIITTIAGNGTQGYSGDGGMATSAELNGPVGIIFDSSGVLYIADANNNRIRKINSLGIITTIAGTGTSGYSGDNISTTSAELNIPVGLTIDNLDNLFIADENNNRIRKVNSSGIITTIAGNGTSGYSGDNGFATTAELNTPADIAIDNIGNLYIADGLNNAVRKINTIGIITTIAGTGTAGYSGDNMLATSTELNGPIGLVSDTFGNFFIADTQNNRIRKINTAGIITTIAGTGVVGYAGDNGQATSAKLNTPCGMIFDAAGNLYIADTWNNAVRKIDTTGVITTVVGTGTAGYNGDGIAATSAQLYKPAGLVFDKSGNLYISDYGNNRIRKVTNVGQVVGIQQLAGNIMQVTVYPNPSNGSFVIEPSSTTKQTMQVYDVNGKLVLSQTINGKTSIDANSLNEGVYNISLQSNEGVVNKRLVIVR
jgi:hypothetical protein